MKNISFFLLFYKYQIFLFVSNTFNYQFKA